MSQQARGVVQQDPYVLTPEGIKEPPVGWGAHFKYLGPGMILTASIVGSGELIATTTMGSTAGFALLWMVIFSCAVKVALQVELARFAISTGIPTLGAFNMVPPKIGPYSWINWIWAVFAITKWVQSAGIIGGVAQILQIWFPISIYLWTAVVVVGTIALLFSSAYSFLEKGAFYLVVVFSVITVIIAFGLPFTPFAYTLSDVASGLTFQIPAGTLGVALAMFGITGVGSDEISMYPYWCLEKGYARWSGPNDGSTEWARRANGWMKVMHKDVIVAFTIYTFATLAFFMMGAAVLFKQGIKPEGAGSVTMIASLGRMYTDTLGPWAKDGFLLGAFAVLGSTLWAGVPSWSRQWTNWMAVGGMVDWKNPSQRIKVIRAWTVFLPIVWGVVYLFVQQPVQLVWVGGIATSLFLFVLVVAIWYLRQNYTDKRLYGSTAFNVLLMISSVAIAWIAINSFLNVFGIVLFK